MADRPEPGPVDPSRKPVGPSTLSVHGGEPRPKPAHALATPIVQTATYTFSSTQELKDHFDGKIERVEYGRYGNPTQSVAEAKLAALEGAGDCLLFGSGMGSMTTALFAMLSRGTHVVVTDDSYRRTRQFLNQTLSRYGIEVSTVPAGDYEALEDAIKPTTRVLVSESPTNPYNRILDLERFATIGRSHRVKTVIDATFATPAVSARRWGSTWWSTPPTKYWRPQRPAGRGGAGSAELVGAVRGRHTGAVLDPFAATCSCGASRPSPCAWAPERERPGGGRVFVGHPHRGGALRSLSPTPSTPSRASRCAASGGGPSRSRVSTRRPGWSTCVPSSRPRWAGWKPDRAARDHELLRATSEERLGRHQGQPDPVRGRYR
jgi:hypothetical protein